MEHNMLVPLPFNGNVHEFKKRIDLHIGYEWINQIPTNKKIYLALFQRWPYVSDVVINLPNNYDVHIVSFHLEAIDVDWLKAQSKLINGEIIVLFDGSSNGYTIPKVRFLSYYYWHIQLDKMMEWFGIDDTPKKITHKASVFCNRATSSKLITFAALAEYLNTDDCMLVLHDWIEEKNVYSESDNVPPILRELHDIFMSKYHGVTTYKIDDYDVDHQNFQKHTANPWQPSYQNCALHFTNESFDSSDCFDSALYSYPGPFITEKTLKCLLGGTAFVPIGQFDTYGTLKRLGFRFDYGFDTSFDTIIQDNDRLVAVIKLIQTVATEASIDIFNGTKESSDYNFNYIKGGDFSKRCYMINQHTVEQIMEHIDLVTG